MIQPAGSAAATANQEQETIARARQGDRQAFGMLAAHYQAAVVNVVYRMCGDLALAEESAQEAFIKAWLHLASYRPQFSFRSWLYRIAINTALDVLRRRPTEAALDDLALASTLEGPEAALERRERAQQVRRAVLALPPASRAVLVLREYQGLSYQEIAAALDIPLGTVMSRLNYARGQLRTALAAYLEEV
ncbi:MAG TPA: sigma-70 family RNA polymerase sigma factor [Anaerolineales bacterium]|nr:sigma-70 family RNA polymerase sigma factor [Anaerolineales bacterium]